MAQLKSALQSIRSWRGWRIVGWAALALLIVAVIGALVYGVTYVVQHQGTGFDAYTDLQGNFTPGKTLWDWISLLGVPVMLALTTAGFGVIQERNRQKSDRTARDLEAERARETALQAYLDDIGQLIREENLGAAPPEDEERTAKSRRERIRALADAKTKTILAVLKYDNSRRINAVEFLGRAGLITAYGIRLEGADLSSIDLSGADMTGAILSKANLREAVLGETNLQGAMLNEANLQEARTYRVNLQRANVNEADLQGASLIFAQLQQAELILANLQGTDLNAAQLQRADLGGTNLQGAALTWTYLQGTRLSHANLQGADLEEAKLDEHSKLPDDTLWTPQTDMSRFTNPKHPDFWRSDNPESPAYRGEKESD